jgi:hypothetical protein
MKYKRIRARELAKAVAIFQQNYPELKIVKTSKRYRFYGKYYFNIYYKKEKPKKLYRMSFAINMFRLHKCYYSLVLRMWHKNKAYLEDIFIKYEDRIKDFLIQKIEDWLGYREEELWFEIEALYGYEKPKEVTYVEHLHDKVELVWEFKGCSERGIPKELPDDERWDTIKDFISQLI